MTNYAFFLQHRRDGFAVADLFVRLVFLCEVDQATNGIALGDFNWFSRKDRFDRVRSIVFRCLVLLTLINLAVVDWAAVDDFPTLRIDDQDLTRANQVQ